MKRNTFDENRDHDVAEETPRSNRCPAFRCPNAANVFFDTSARWACYFHAREQVENWPGVTDEVRSGWPATANWNHPEKAVHEANRRAARKGAGA